MTLKHGSYENLRNWYLARLRKLAAEAELEIEKTPASVIELDREFIKQLAEEVASKTEQRESKAQISFGLSRAALAFLLMQVLLFLTMIFDKGDLISGANAYFSATIACLFSPLFPVRNYMQLSAFALFYFSPFLILAALPTASFVLNQQQDFLYRAIQKLSDSAYSKLFPGMLLLMSLSSILFFKDFLPMSIAYLSLGSTFAMALYRMKDASVFEAEQKVRQLINQIGFDRFSTGQFQTESSDSVLDFANEPGLEAKNEAAALSLSSKLSLLDAELKKLILRERAIADYSETILFALKSPGFEIESFSPNLSKFWGYLPFELAGKNLKQLIFKQDLSQFEAVLAELDKTRTATVECRIIRKDNSLLDCRWYLDWSPRFQLIFATCSDVTVEKDLERTRQDLIAKLTHDMRSPLSAAKLSLSTLLEKKLALDEAAANAIRRSQSGLGRVLALIEDILEIEKLDSGKVELNLDDYMLSSLARQAVDELKSVAEEKSVSVQVQGENLRVYVDPKMILRVISNLLSNAISFAPENSLVLVEMLAKGKQAFLKVSDQGPGLAEEDQRVVFERFFTAANFDSSKRKSSGLGLSICREIVRAHNGQIGVESKPGAGSSFWFTVALSPENDD